MTAVVPDSSGARRPTPPRASRTGTTTAASPARPGRPAPARRSPSLRHERALLSSGARLVAGMDEVGRGALAGPVSVGVVVVDAATRTAPAGLTDSKLLTAGARELLVPQVRRWGVAWAVGHAGPAEIDAHGIVAALRIAGRRALAQVRRACGDVDIDVVLLDGSHDWLSRPQADLFEAVAHDPDAEPTAGDPAVRTLVKADLQCSSVAAASVLAKVERDGLLARLARQYPAYAWDQNKGYSAPAHLDALRRLGPTPQHRRSWNLRVLADEAVGSEMAAGDSPGSSPGSAASAADASYSSPPLADLGGMMGE